MTEDQIVKRRVQLLEAEVDGELVALDVDQGNCYGFNATATRVWAMLDEPKRVSELRDALLEQYEVDPETCERELIALLQDLESQGLLELERAAA
ncbi:MAG TPA: PqqD family protein [Allosphingosinicella sp.]